MFSELTPSNDLVGNPDSWFGMSPARWGVLPARALFDESTVTGHESEPLLSVTIRRGVIPQSDLLSDSSKKDSSNLDRSKYKLVEPGEIVYNKMRAWQGALGLSRHRGIVSPAYVVMRPRRSSAQFFEELMRTPAFAKEAERWSYGITSDMWSLRPEHFKMIYFPVAPADEQAAIVKYLGHAHVRIDRAIAAKRKLIALLEEQKQAIIHQAITRGLDPSVPLKDSGIPWLGEIPARWKLVSTGAVSQLIQTGPFGSQLHAADYVNGGTPVINPSHLKGGTINPDSGVAVDSAAAARLARHATQLGDVLIARRGDLGRSAVVREAQIGWLCGTGSLILRLREGTVIPDYYQSVLSTPAVKEALESTSVGSTMANLSAGTISRMRMPIPPFDEQSEIVEAVVEANRACAEVRERCHDEIELIREFRTRLTSDVVTGQVDVREIAATLPELTDDLLAGADDEFGDDGEQIESELEFAGADE